MWLARWAGALALVAAALPPALVLRTWAAVRDDLNVPFWDQWKFVPLLEAASTGTLGLAHLWAQDVECRPIVTRLLMLGLALATGWDVRWEMAVNLAIAATTIAVLALLVRHTVRPWSPALVPWLVLAASIVTFSLGQWEAWLWGWSLGQVLSALAACVALWTLALWGRRWPGPLLAMLVAVAATFSFTNGLLLLVLIPVGLFLDPRRGATMSERAAPIVTAAFGIAIAIVNFAGFTAPGTSPVLLPITHPADFATYVLAYLGAPFGAPAVVASAWWGAIGLGMLVAGGSWLWARHPTHRASVLPWLLLASYVSVTGAVTGVGRFRWGIDQALSSRYQTFSALFWVSVFVVATLAARELVVAPTRPRALAIGVMAVAAAGVWLAALGYSGGWIAADATLRHRGEVLRRGRECLRFHRLAPDECLGLLHPDPALLRDRARRLEALALGPFASSEGERPLSAYGADNEQRPSGWLDQVRLSSVVLVNMVSGRYPSREVVVSGWAIDPVARRPARSVLVVVDGRVVGRAKPAAPRADVARALGDDAVLYSGWMFRFGAFRLRPGSHAVEAWAVLADGRIARLGGARTIDTADRPT